VGSINSGSSKKPIAMAGHLFMVELSLSCFSPSNFLLSSNSLFLTYFFVVDILLIMLVHKIVFSSISISFLESA